MNCFEFHKHCCILRTTQIPQQNNNVNFLFEKTHRFIEWWRWREDEGTEKWLHSSAGRVASNNFSKTQFSNFNNRTCFLDVSGNLVSGEYVLAEDSLAKIFEKERATQSKSHARFDASKPWKKTCKIILSDRIFRGLVRLRTAKECAKASGTMMTTPFLVLFVGIIFFF